MEQISVIENEVQQLEGAKMLCEKLAQENLQWIRLMPKNIQKTKIKSYFNHSSYYDSVTFLDIIPLKE